MTQILTTHAGSLPRTPELIARSDRRAYKVSLQLAGNGLLIQDNREALLQPGDIAQVLAHVHQGALDVLGPVVDPRTVHQSKFSMGTVLALVAQFGHAGLTEFEREYRSRLKGYFESQLRALNGEGDGQVALSPSQDESTKHRLDELIGEEKKN